MLMHCHPAISPALNKAPSCALLCRRDAAELELRDEARAAVLAHLCHGMDMQAKKGLAFVLKVTF